MRYEYEMTICKLNAKPVPDPRLIREVRQFCTWLVYFVFTAFLDGYEFLQNVHKGAPPYGNS